ncbi:UDP-N-acetylglucosamine 4,6-dehydratase (inverting) [Prosthecobacter debontii]|uniref:UDP-N-acetylglucosamine 4,6-dehydratase (Inverting) n=1 Tax=Prosthecobacter debontii TaxID=48467 RepID=A0A1T4XUT5_9BACT|nr:UDP-N-acetylglucosamine 4,6-dehydratase (inverting) [Prosthecobacter debontii]SKA92825.1 UDP-N-acetylglucosamine 4,6-dehydratase (inverting) [Prosthecobacter debontii]
MSSARSILVTGGTGSFGQKCIATLLADPEVKRIVIYSRDELKQFEMSQKFTDPRLRFFLGDVRDRARLCRALEGVDTVIHAAALKQVPAAEYNPMEFIKTNVLGAENLIEACMDTGVRNVVALSTDKAAAPINLYGATKLCSDKLFIAANNVKGSRDIRFSVVRYGNVMGSRGSVIPFFLDRRKTGILPITDLAMTRFNITLQEGVELVQYALERALGGEIFVPKIPSYRITDVAEAIGPNCEKPVVGIRPGEKIHEEMVTSTDALQTIMTDRHYIIVPSGKMGLEATLKKFSEHHQGRPVAADFAYNSGTNTEWLTVSEIRTLIRQHVDSSFDLT